MAEKRAMVHLTRRLDFSASHRYCIEGLSEEENFRLFGKCSYSGGHGHNYTLEVTVKGEPDPDTGMVINLSDLDRIIRHQVIDTLDHRFINVDVPGFDRKIPTPENLVLFIFDRLAASLEGTPCRLHRVRLHEDPYLYAEYTEE